MQQLVMWRRQFNWRMLLMRIVVNAIALFITVVLLPNISFDRRYIGQWIVVAVVLGVLNAIVKPIIQFLTLRFIFATYGLVLVLINAVLLILLARIFGDSFRVTSVLSALIGGAVLGIVSAVLESLMGISPPIVSEKYAQVRERIRARETGTVEAMITQTAVGGKLQPEGAQPNGQSDAAAILAAVGDDESAQPAPPEQAATNAATEQPPAPAQQEA